MKKLNGRCEDVTEAVKECCEDVKEVDKENQGNAETQVVLILCRALYCNFLVSPPFTGRPQGRYYRPLVDNRPFCLNGRYS